jgi:CHAT domain-containing protein
MRSQCSITTVRCTGCGARHDLVMYAVVDVRERPDLLAEIKTGRWRTGGCPKCGRGWNIEPWVLLYRPDTPKLVANTSDHEMLGFLLAVLGTDDIPELRAATTNDVLVVDSDQLGADDETFRQLFLEDQELRGFRGEPVLLEWPRSVPADVRARLTVFMSATTWDGSQRVVEADPDLYGDECMRHLRALINSLRATGFPAAGLRFITEHYDLLNRCREVGIAAAVAERMDSGLSARSVDSGETFNQSLDTAWPEPEEQADDDIHVFEDLPSMFMEYMQMAQEASSSADRVDHLRSAIESLDRQEVSPEVWALLNFTVANLLLAAKTRDTTLVIRLYHNARQVFTPEHDPDLWGQVCTNLAHIYSFVGRHEEALNLLVPVAKVWAASGIPHAAAVHIELAPTYRSRPAGSRQDNLDAAIRSWRTVVGDGYLRARRPSAVAEAGADLGDALFERWLVGGRDEDRERAVTAYSDARRMYQRLGSDDDVARVDAELEDLRGHPDAQRAPAGGDSPQAPPGTDPLQARMTLEGLPADEKADGLITGLLGPAGIAIRVGDLNSSFFTVLKRRIRAAANDPEILHSLEQIETELLELAGSEDYARIAQEPTTWLANMGLSEEAARDVAILVMAQQAQWLRTRPVGDKAVDLEQAKEILSRAVGELRKDSAPDLAANVLIGLALCYMRSSVDHPIDNHRHAVQLLKTALEYVGNRDEFASEAATVLINLAATRLYLARNDDQVLDVLHTYRRALERADRAGDARLRALIQLDLSELYATKRTVAPEAIEKSISNARAAADFFATADGADARDSWLTATMNLGIGLLRQAQESTVPELASQARSAGITALEEVLAEAEPSLHSSTVESAAVHLAAQHKRDGQRLRARSALLTAISAAEARLARANTIADQVRRADTIGNYYEALAFFYADDDSGPMAVEALVAAENGKARRFLMDLAFDVPPLPPDDRVKVRESFERIASEQRELERAASRLRPTDPGAIRFASQRAKLATRAHDLRAKTLREHPDLAGALSHYGRAGTSWEAVARLATALGPGRALVEFVVRGGRILALVVKPGLTAPIAVSIDTDLRTVWYRYAEPFNLFRRAGLEGREDMASASAWQALGDVVLAPLEEHLEDVELVCFVNDSWLADLPLHALHVRGAPLIERREVTYAPSFSILNRLRARRPTPTAAPGDPVSFGYADEDVFDGLFQAEARSVARLFGTEALIGASASRERLRRETATARMIHVSCHAEFTAEDPMASALLLADGRFTARDWLGTSLRADLVSLSACDTGRASRSAGDEMAGIGRAMLTAGARATVLTSWEVRALSTKAWFERFYRAVIEENAPIPQAFRTATLELRDQVPDPYAWAPFHLLGGIV